MIDEFSKEGACPWAIAKIVGRALGVLHAKKTMMFVYMYLLLVK